MEKKMYPLEAELTKAIENDGVVLLRDDRISHTFAEMVKDNPTSIQFLSEYGLAMVFFFDRAQQPEKLQKFDGLVYKHVNTKTDDEVFSIGISSQAMNRGKEYANLVWMHEAAHIFHGESIDAHDGRFRDLINVMIAECNTATGSHIVNDYEKYKNYLK